MNKKSAGNVLAGFLTIISGIFHLVNDEGRPTGKLKFILAPIYDATGDTGYAIAIILIGILFLTLGHIHMKGESK